MDQLTAPLVADHRHCDGLFATAEDAAQRTDWAACRERFDAFRAAMLQHFEIEENVLFPAFEQATGMTMGPTATMRSEHAQMRDLLENMTAVIAAGRRDDYLGLSETLLLYMQQHNLKEENVLYPMSDQVLAASGIDLTQQTTACE
ncbi:MAG: hemerythrin domain-containing protein [Betaproteobacteria bacterium]|nr:hemerythrin domain-containing protein [Betaproteobacteria bacterium]MBI2291486.1 hemerythrin domain-containing protein [Betaproteobacteria bacterium]